MREIKQRRGFAVASDDGVMEQRPVLRSKTAPDNKAMQQAETHRGFRADCGGIAESDAVLSTESGKRDAVPGHASIAVSGLRVVVVPASPRSLLASSFGGSPLRRRFVVAIAVRSASRARHSQSLQRTASPPAELFRYAS